MYSQRPKRLVGGLLRSRMRRMFLRRCSIFEVLCTHLRLNTEALALHSPWSLAGFIMALIPAEQHLDVALVHHVAARICNLTRTMNLHV